jgi:hypothetical protein
MKVWRRSRVRRKPRSTSPATCSLAHSRPLIGRSTSGTDALKPREVLHQWKDRSPDVTKPLEQIEVSLVRLGLATEPDADWIGEMFVECVGIASVGYLQIVVRVESQILKAFAEPAAEEIQVAVGHRTEDDKPVIEWLHRNLTVQAGCTPQAPPDGITSAEPFYSGRLSSGSVRDRFS